MKAIEHHLKQLQEVKKEMQRKLLNLPQNPSITIINNNCFTINLSQLKDGLNLSPNRYDFKHQYKIISEQIEKKPIEKLVNYLKEVVRTKQIKVNTDMYNKMRVSSFNYTLNLDDEVVKNIKNIIK